MILVNFRIEGSQYYLEDEYGDIHVWELNSRSGRYYLHNPRGSNSVIIPINIPRTTLFPHLPHPDDGDFPFCSSKRDVLQVLIAIINYNQDAGYLQAKVFKLMP